MLDIEYHTVVLISFLESAQAVGIGPSPKCMCRYHPGADARDEIKTTVWCCFNYIIYLKSKTFIQITNKEYNVTWRSYRFFSDLQNLFFLFLFICVKNCKSCWTLLTNDCYLKYSRRESVVWNEALSSRFQIIERETSILRIFVMSQILSLGFRKFPVRFHS